MKQKKKRTFAIGPARVPVKTIKRRNLTLAEQRKREKEMLRNVLLESLSPDRAFPTGLVFYIIRTADRTEHKFASWLERTTAAFCVIPMVTPRGYKGRKGGRTKSKPQAPRPVPCLSGYVFMGFPMHGTPPWLAIKSQNEYMGIMEWEGGEPARVAAHHISAFRDAILASELAWQRTGKNYSAGDVVDILSEIYGLGGEATVSRDEGSTVLVEKAFFGTVRTVRVKKSQVELVRTAEAA